MMKGVVYGANSLLECDKELLTNMFKDDNGNIPLVVGEIKENSDGIIITDYLADCILAKYKAFGIAEYEDIVKDETYLTKNYNVKVDAIIKTGYDVEYADIIEKIKDGIEEVTDEYSEVIDYILTKLSLVYSLNPDYYESYVEGIKSLETMYYSANVYLQEYVTDEMTYEYDHRSDKVYFDKELNEKEFLLNHNAYNALFNTNCSTKDESEFKQEKITVKLYDSNKEAYYVEEYTIVGLTGNNAVFPFSVKDIVEATVYERTGIFVLDNGDLGEVVSYAVNNDLLVDSSRMNVVQKAVSVVAVFEDLFTLLLVLIIIAIIVLVVIHTINTYNKNIYNIGVSKSMGAHMFELSFIFAIQMIVFGVLIIVASLFADRYCMNVINDIIANAIPRIVDIPGANEITYVYFNPIITTTCSGMIMVLTIISIIVPLMTIRLMNPVNIIKSRQ